MKVRGTRGGILLVLDQRDTLESVEAALSGNRQLLEGRVLVEVAGRVEYPVLEVVADRVCEAGGELVEIRPPAAAEQARGETVIVSKTVRSGARIESSGSVVVLGDVNAGAELVANDDIIVLGLLRGVAHAGANGNEKAVIWAQRILSPQLRIGGALAQAGDGRSEGSRPEVALLEDARIVVRPWG